MGRDLGKGSGADRAPGGTPAAGKAPSASCKSRGDAWFGGRETARLFGQDPSTRSWVLSEAGADLRYCVSALRRGTRGANCSAGEGAAPTPPCPVEPRPPAPRLFSRHETHRHLGKPKSSGASASPGRPMATNMPGAVEELSPQPRPQGGRVQIQTGASGTSPLPYSRVDFPTIPGDVSSPTSQQGGCRPPLSAEPSSELQRGGEVISIAGIGAALAVPPPVFNTGRATWPPSSAAAGAGERGASRRQDGLFPKQ